MPSEFEEIAISVGRAEDGCLALQFEGANVFIDESLGSESPLCEAHFGNYSRSALLALRNALNESIDKALMLDQQN